MDDRASFTGRPLAELSLCRGTPKLPIDSRALEVAGLDRSPTITSWEHGEPAPTVQRFNGLDDSKARRLDHFRSITWGFTSPLLPSTARGLDRAPFLKAVRNLMTCPPCGKLFSLGPDGRSHGRGLRGTRRSKGAA